MWENPIGEGATFWNMEATECLRKLDSGADGLENDQATKRFYPAEKVSPLKRELKLFFSRFADPMMLLLLVAVVLSAALGENADAAIILFILVSSASLAYVQHSRAGHLLEKLQALVVLSSSVVRAGKAHKIPSIQVVPGDVLEFKAGDIVPADCLLLESNELHTNESGFTGESFPVRKTPGILPLETVLSLRSNCLWKGSNIVSGSGTALAIHTGEAALFGRIIKDSGQPLETGFEKGLREFGFFLMRITLVLSLVILILNFFNHKGVVEAALFSLALAVGMAPELLPAITTLAMSAGARRLLEKKVIVKNLNSIQNLGEVSLLCTDKTGTLTEGRISCAGFLNAEGKEDDLVRAFACFNAMLATSYSNPMEDALRQVSVSMPDGISKTGEVPYDFLRKRVSVSIKKESVNQLISKGAFPGIMEICTQLRLPDGSLVPLEDWRERLFHAFEDFGASGLRTLAVAYKEMDHSGAHKADEHDMIFAGFALFHDPVKPGIESALLELKQLKVGLKILSGDSLAVVSFIAGKIGMESPKTMTGAELDKTGTEALSHLVKHTDIFAEIEPRQKERIIRALRKHHILAYMGDGINDVTALHAADVGISVNNAAGIAIEASDFVLLKKDISVLADGIREGRKTFANTLKYIYISTGSTFGNMFSVAIASLFLPFIPMLPKQILLTNFISDFPFLAVASDIVDQEQTLSPGRWNIKLVRDFMLVFGLHSSAFDLLTYFFLFHMMKLDASQFRTAWFLESVFTELLILFVVRTQRPFFRSMPSKPLLFLGVLAMLITAALPWLTFVPWLDFLPLQNGVMAGLAAILLLYLITADLLKLWFFRWHKVN